VVLEVIFHVLLTLHEFTNLSIGIDSVLASMLTFISDEKLRERMEALSEIFRIVDDLEPDLVTFQEVTHDNLAVLQEALPG